MKNIVWNPETDMVSEPPVPCPFKVGDLVRFTNEYGCVFEPRKVIGFSSEVVLSGRFIHLDTCSPWFPVTLESLSPYDPNPDFMGLFLL